MKNGSLADRRFETDYTVVPVDHDVVGNGQALSSTSTDLLGGEKEVEHPVADVFRNTQTRVLNANFRVFAVLPGRDGDQTFLCRPSLGLFDGMGGVDDEV